jgi:hypothetical protein
MREEEDLKRNPDVDHSSFMSNERGNILLIVLVIALVANIMIISASYAGRSTVKRSGDERINVSLVNIAEAGKEDAFSKLKSGAVSLVSGTRIDVASNSNFGGGAYAVTCSSNVAMDTIWVVSRASYTGKTKEIEVIYNVTGGVLNSAAFDKAICAGGNITWTGSGNANAGTAQVYCNGSFTISGSSKITANISVGTILMRSGSSCIYGNVTSPTSPVQSGSGSITSVTIAPVAIISIPVLDLTPYYNYALTNGQVYLTDVNISGSSDYVVTGGVMWVNGTFKRSGSGNFSGCVIATGDIDVSGSGNYTKVNAYPIAVSINGKIDFSGSGNVTGLLFAQNGNFEKTGSGNVTGSIICKGNCRKSGSWDFLTFVKSIPIPPGGSTIALSVVSWKER